MSDRANGPYRGPGAPSPGRAGGFGDLKRAAVLLGGYPWLLVGTVASLAISVAATVTVPQATRRVIDSIASARKDQVHVAIIGGLTILGLTALRAVFSFLQDYLAGRAGEGVAFDLRNALLVKLGRLPYAYHDTADTGQLMARMSSDVDAVTAFTGAGLAELLYTVAIVVTTAVILLVTNARLALFSLVVVPPMVFLLIRFQVVAHGLFSQIGMGIGMIIGIFQENLTGTRVVRVFRRESHETRRLTGAADGLYETMMRLMRAISWFFPVTQLFAFAMTTIVVGVGGYDVIGGRLSLGELVAFSAYVSILVGPLFGIGGLVFQIAGATASAGLINAVLDERVPARDGSADGSPAVAGRIAYVDVSLRYPGNTVDTISNVSFTAELGEIVALVGPTGSGKSSLVQLLPRFYEATGGRIELDGQDIREIPIAALRDQIGIVPQATWLMRGTIRDNIAFGHPDASTNGVEAAAQWASAARFIEALPLGYDTHLGEAGSGLSGGQQQRIALARALLKRPPILILDDATSALDAATERDVLDALRSLPFPCLLLMTTSRLAVVETADSVLVLAQGRLIASGRHSDLLERNETYAALFGVAAEPEREDATV